MGWKNYSFHFLDTISRQLVEELALLPISALDDVGLAGIGNFQNDIGSSQGVYLLYLDGAPVYLGKAGDIKERLAQHRLKLSGRMDGDRRLDLQKIGFKALLLDQSMSTAANEDVLISFFRKSHAGLWNNKGFGPKDPGKERDTTKPSYFDTRYPINRNFPVGGAVGRITIGALFRTMKQELPYVFRYQSLPDAIETTLLDVTDVSKEARSLLIAAMNHFPVGWHAALVAHGIVVYQGVKRYWQTSEVIVSPGTLMRTEATVPGTRETDADVEG